MTTNFPAVYVECQQKIQTALDENNPVEAERILDEASGMITGIALTAKSLGFFAGNGLDIIKKAVELGDMDTAVQTMDNYLQLTNEIRKDLKEEFNPLEDRQMLYEGYNSIVNGFMVLNRCEEANDSLDNQIIILDTIGHFKAEYNAAVKRKYNLVETSSGFAKAYEEGRGALRYEVPRLKK